MKMLNDLWAGKIVPWEKTFNADAAYCAAVHHLADADQRLREALDPAQVELLDLEQNAEAELNAITRRDMFFYAFCLGAGMILDVLEGTG